MTKTSECTHSWLTSKAFRVYKNKHVKFRYCQLCGLREHIVLREKKNSDRVKNGRIPVGAFRKEHAKLKLEEAQRGVLKQLKQQFAE